MGRTHEYPLHRCAANAYRMTRMTRTTRMTRMSRMTRTTRKEEDD